MKLSCLPVSLYPELTAGARTLADWFRLAAELGLDGADVSVVHLPGRRAADLRPVRQQAEAAGVQIAMLVTYADFTHPDATERARQVEEIQSLCEVAAELGASFMRVTAGQNHPGLERSAGIEWAVAGLTACLDKAAASGVTLCYENHTKGYAWTYNDFSQPADRFLEIVRRTAGTSLRLLYDTANTLAAGDDPLAVLEAVKERVSMVHVNDIRRAGFFETGFDGWVSVEEASKTGEEGFRLAIPTTERLWVAAGGSPRAR
ncbi:MAG TPA: sugar phosphate isomerase/epimerase family protein [Caldilineaceae bacterium]|nr:sugar phosphate isomerase/epimerase family protein [Caldilineaceae bacterium]